MIALWRGTAADARFGEAGRVASSLGLFAGVAADTCDSGSTVCWRLDGPRPRRVQRGWRPAQGLDGSVVLLDGWIDNEAELASALGAAADDPAALYGAAVARWGAAADARVIGSYSAIVARPDGSVRLARSPWTAPPLAYARVAGGIMAASVPRALFAAGHPAELNRDRVLDSLMFNFHQDEEGWFTGVRRVPQGSVVELGSERERLLDRWYDPLAIAPVRLAGDDAYLEAANAMLAEAVAKALRAPTRPGIKLSGGLDSTIVADEIMRQRPEPLDSFTFVPRADWDGVVPPDLMGDERPWVEAFAEMHPRLRPHFTDNAAGDFDSLEREFFVAMSGAPSLLPTFQPFHGVWADARNAGCDWLLHAMDGNISFSADGEWSYQEDLLRGQWRQLYHTLSRRRGDPRPLWRKLAALSILPLLPTPVVVAARRLVHPARGTVEQINSVVRNEVLADPRLVARQGATAAIRARKGVRGRAEMIAMIYATSDAEGAEVMHGAEQVFGLRQRDVTAYRPLIEFCFGLPTRQYVSGGEERWLAKRMAVGRMPEAQRLNPRYGRHNVDWHARMTPRRGALASEAKAMRGDPWLSEIFDLDRLDRLLEEWPATTPWAPEVAYPRMIGITRAIQAARFVRFAEGRNTV